MPGIGKPDLPRLLSELSLLLLEQWVCLTLASLTPQHTQLHPTGVGVCDTLADNRHTQKYLHHSQTAQEIQQTGHAWTSESDLGSNTLSLTAR